jgi:hypothetical protein
VGSGGKQDARERTKIYDEMAAAGKRFEQLSGLPFTGMSVSLKNGLFALACSLRCFTSASRFALYN